VVASRWGGLPPAPPPVADSPFRNTLSGVAYVGDEVCATCHAEIAAAYRKHPMARSLRPVTPADADPPGSFEKIGFHFSVKRSAGRVVHVAERRDGKGEVVIREELPVDYCLGSGTRGKSFLAARVGRLVQSPLSWYSQAGGWDLSPGFASFYPDERPIVPVCLYCHANAADPVPGARNAYREPLFRGHGIGCERCHGPGELHARSPGDRDPAGGFDRTIVNPKHLEPALREGVCQQCHLQGARRFERRGRGTFDYRPGLPLGDYWAVFVHGPGAGDDKAVSQVEQMYQSRCFAGSGGRLGCASCHDPHSLPGPRDRVKFYRERCQSCHAAGPKCSVPVEERTRKATGDDCAACHMPRQVSSDIAHTAVTDHRVLRHPEAPRGRPAPAPPGASGRRLVSFFGDRAGDPDVDRDLGLALVHTDPMPGPRRNELVEEALPLLEAAADRHPDDVPAVEGLGWGWAALGRPDRALESYRAALAHTPDRELTLVLAAQAAESLRLTDNALGYMRRAAELNPYRGEYHTELAKLYARKGDWAAVLRSAEAALRWAPAAKEPRMLRVTGLLRSGQQEQAARELETLIRLSPKEEELLRGWFAKQR